MPVAIHTLREKGWKARSKKLRVRRVPVRRQGGPYMNNHSGFVVRNEHLEVEHAGDPANVSKKGLI